MNQRVVLLGFGVLSAFAVAVACREDSEDAATPADGGIHADAADALTSDDDATSPGDAANDGDDTPFTPASLASRLVLWLDGAKSVTITDAGRDADTVGSWGDLSGNKNDAKQANPTQQPRRLEGSSDAGVGGLPVIAFDLTARLIIAESPSLIWGKEDFAIFAVFRYRNTPGVLGLVIGKYVPTGDPSPGPKLYGNYFERSTTSIVGRVDFDHYAMSADGGYNDGKVHIAAVRRTGTSLEVRVDGASTINPDAGSDGGPIDVSAPDGSVYVGSGPSLVSWLNGEIAEIVGVRGKVTDDEVAAIEAYFRKKFGL